MEEPLKSISYKHNLIIAQRILSIHLNVVLRVLRGNAVDNILKIWKNKNAPYDALYELIKKEPQKDPLSERIDENLQYWFYPSVKEKNKQFEAKISSAMWVSPPSSPNPFYQELIQCFPIIKVFERLHYLRLLYKYSSVLNDPSTFFSYDNPIGLNEHFVTIKKPNNANYTSCNILVIGSVWLEDNIRQEGIQLSLCLEKYVYKLLNRLQEDTKRHLDYEQYSYLFSQVMVYPIFRKKTVEGKTKIASKVFAKLDEIEHQYPEYIEKLSTSEWLRLVQWILFWNTDKSKLICKQYIDDQILMKNSFYKKISLLINFLQKEKVKIIISRPLSDNKEHPFIINIVFQSPEKSQKIEPDFELVKAEKSDTFLWVEVENIDTYSKKLIQDEMHKFYRYFLNRGEIMQSHMERVYFDHLRLLLQRMPFEDTFRRSELIAKKASQLLISNMTTFYKYNGLKNVLEPVAIFKDSEAKSLVRGNKKVTKKEAQQILKQVIEECGGSKEPREKSSAYRCLDNRCIISRYTSDKIASPFSLQVQDNVQTLKVDYPWFFEEKDILAAPIMFHGRKLGVIHLSMMGNNQFFPKDRQRLLNFIQMFEAELFEANLMNMLQKMNDDLLKAIHGNISSSNFFDRLAEYLADLLGASGISLWWKPEEYTAVLKVIGLAGDRINRIFGRGELILNSTDLIVKNVFESKNPSTPLQIKDIENKGTFGRAFFDSGLKGLIQIPMCSSNNAIMGLVMIHDWETDINLSTPLIDELVFLGQEVRQRLMHYFEHQGQLQNLRYMVGHDLDSALRIIDGARNRLKPYSNKLEGEERRDFSIRLNDIEKAIRLTHELYDVMTKGTIKKEIQTKPSDPLLALQYHLNLLEPLEKQIELDKILNSILHPYQLIFAESNMRFIHKEKIPPVWLHENIIRHVLNNLIDNAAKYGKPNTNVEIIDHKTPAEWQIWFSNEGYSLNEEAEKDNEIVFEIEKHCVSSKADKKFEGKGIGLYIARNFARNWGGDLILLYTHERGDLWARYKFILTFPLWLFNKDNPWHRKGGEL